MFTALANESSASNIDVFVCDAGDIGYEILMNAATPEYVTVNVSVSEMMDQSLAREFDLSQVQTSSGFGYSTPDGVSFFGKGTQGVLEILGDRLECELLKPSFQSSATTNHNEAGELIQRSGRSLGGSLRDGPGTNFSKLGSLAFGDTIVIVRNTNIVFDGYDWFEINYMGRTAYQWGGIMCVDGPLLPGIYQTCTEAFR
ncbi:MAG: hypothetical protein HWE23_05820 [Rhodobacteraceae bacterium]|nr:hypothetical protein [Paracoccaceae bacterium]